MISDLEREQTLEAILEEAEKIRLNPDVRAVVPEIDERFCIGSSFLSLAPESGDESGAKFHTIKRHWRGVQGVIEYKLYLVHPEDPLKWYIEGKWDGFYQTLSHILALKLEFGETYRSKAFQLIHEWGHMLRAAREGRIFTESIHSEQENLEEAEMRTFDYKLLLALGDATYKSKAEEVAYKIFRWRTGQQKNPPPDEGFETALDSCFGPATTPEARLKRKLYFKFYCHLMAADRHMLPQEALKYKLGAIAFQEKHM